MTAVALFVEFDIDPDQLAAFDALIADHAAKTLAGEAGCMDFQVHVDRENPNKYLLYELYRDDAALVAHRETAQLTIFRAAAADMLLGRKVIEGLVRPRAEL